MGGRTEINDPDVAVDALRSPDCNNLAVPYHKSVIAITPAPFSRRVETPAWKSEEAAWE